MSTSKLKASEIPFLSNTNIQDPRTKEKPLRKHKVPLTAKGMPSEQQPSVAGVVISRQVSRAELTWRGLRCQMLE